MARVTGEAPGRLDILGGVADYSGSLVLEMPLARTTKVTVIETNTKEFVFRSERRPIYTVAVGTYPRSVPRWVRYPYGCLHLFSSAWHWHPETGLDFEITSTVPESMGLSSSAALEIATLRALEKLSGKTFTGTKLAQLAQRAENEIVGAPCGLMDQLACAHGVKDALLPILCRPDDLGETAVGEPLRLPDDVIAVGWPSGVAHSVSDSPYATARTAAFMGKKLIEQATGRQLKHLTELSPAELQRLPTTILPEIITGRAFKDDHGTVDDPLSIIEANRTYHVRASASFPIEENHRAHAAAALIKGMTHGNNEQSLMAVGELLYQSHAGYSSIGLGCPETDKMVAGVRKLGHANGLYGARVSGGGSGGSVVVLLQRSALPVLLRLARKSDQQIELIT